ncbi:hypothetical protein MGG_14918 [Pyricularia oryzae 70-15]|uniref:Uncharacterized protein n=2 Tax=Pyricularia TaxID=48558 RepID=A0ABQ8NXH3_PYRGI|nr:uncharacterized protein MGG_14918 [Pyricularia oryzae 70-15]KAH8845914.1 hypothetical protein MCOR01_003136 [Pyricularia oryzae]KAI6303446.1 hypothetical protein MCOR33_001334 [Pyricularia grisea]EHA47411.1 hypothetical protein MGG_14918 [Pyricularia oryzae 70-15]KAI6262311.1 hypothetical protein MCOR19_001504 [Pyricularia oryzae]KAI6333732.1 hypothetical protein MCOR30_004189 [Pyricularia oryzae]
MARDEAAASLSDMSGANVSQGRSAAGAGADENSTRCAHSAMLMPENIGRNAHGLFSADSAA